MSSLPARMRKRNLRKNPDYDTPQRAFTENEDGGYSTFHPTKGLRTISARRLRVQNEMLMKYGFIR